MSELQTDLFPASLRRASSLAGVVLLPSLLLALVNGFCFWLVWGEMKEASQHGYAIALIVSSFLPALAGLLSVPSCMRKSEGIPAWLHIGVGLLCLAHVVAFCWLVGKALPSDTPNWVVGPSFGLIQFACMMPGLFVGVWRIAGVRLNVKPATDFGISVLATFLPPALLYISVVVVGRFFTGVMSDALVQPLFVAGLVVGPVLFFVGLLRCLMIVRRFFAQKGEKSRALQMGYVGCVALVLPIAGLLLNKQIPFPADFQNPWPYALTVLNAVFLMIPATGRRRADAVVRGMRLVLFPFTFYFFVVFLPFLPFSIIAILAMGTGFLVLAPTLLFMVHGQILKRDRELEAAAGEGRSRVWMRTFLCVLVIPLAFAARTELDRFALHRTLDFRYKDDFSEDAELPVPPALVRHVLLNVRRFKDGAELPYLTGWYNWRVFDNLLLQDTKAEDLWRLIVGGEPPQPAKEDFMRNAFASLFGGKTRSPERGTGRAQRPVPRKVVLSDVQSTYATTNGETETHVVLKVTSQDMAAQAEYLAKITVPPGVWVSGFRLKIGGTWEDGRVIERKAAEWVYRQIRDVSQRDPAILRYDDEETLTLRVFPLAPNETREVEIAFLCPEGLADAVMVGERRVTLGDGTLKPVCAWADGVFVHSRAWQPPETALNQAQPVGHLVLDCSAGSVWTGEVLTDVLTRAQTAAGGPVESVTLANYERRGVRLEAEGALPGAVRQIQTRMLPSRGAFDAAGVLRQLAIQSRLQSFGKKGPQTVRSPRIVLAGPSVRAALDAVKLDAWQAIRNEFPILSNVLILDEKGVVTPYPVPGVTGPTGQVIALSSGADGRLCLGSGPEKAVFTCGGSGLQIREGSRENERDLPVPDLTVMPKESRWAKGATAWRLQRELDERPARDHLRRDILRASRASGVLTPAGSYIVVENSMQWKMLELKQRQTLAGAAALDLVESPAPRGWLLAALFVLVAWAAKRLMVFGR